MLTGLTFWSFGVKGYTTLVEPISLEEEGATGVPATQS